MENSIKTFKKKILDSCSKMIRVREGKRNKEEEKEVMKESLLNFDQGLSLSLK